LIAYSSHVMVDWALNRPCSDEKFGSLSGHTDPLRWTWWCRRRLLCRH